MEMVRNMERYYEIDGKRYLTSISFRPRKSVGVRLSRDGKTYLVSAPRYLYFDMKRLDEIVLRLMMKLTQKVEKKKEADPEYQNGYLTILGEKTFVGELEQAEIDAYLKKIGLAYLKERVPYWESIMGIKKPYNIAVRTMTSRWAVNSLTTYRVTFATRLMTFSPDIIDSIIVHELAHHFERNHQKKFYDIVYRYYPNYDVQQAKLKKGIHA